MDKPISGILTVNQLKSVLTTLFKRPESDLENLDAQQIAAGEGFTSKIFRLTLKWTDATDDNRAQGGLPQSVILKTPAVDSLGILMQHFSGGQVTDSASLIGMLKYMHNNEIQAYETLGKLDIMPMAAMLASTRYENDKPGYVILEDLKIKAIINEQAETPLSLEQVLNVVEVLGRLHAWCLTTDFPLKDHFGKMEDDQVGFAFFIGNLHKGLTELVENYPEEFKMVDKGKVFRFFQTDNFLKESKNNVGVMGDVLVHADFWSNNIMFKKDDQGRASNHVSAIIDWQTSYMGCAMTDFGRMLADFPVPFVRGHLNEILQKYYTVLMENSKGRLTVTLEDVRSLFEKQYGLHAVQFVMMLNGIISIVKHHNADIADVIIPELIKHGQQNYEEGLKILRI